MSVVVLIWFVVLLCMRLLYTHAEVADEQTLLLLLYIYIYIVCIIIIIIAIIKNSNDNNINNI